MTHNTTSPCSCRGENPVRKAPKGCRCRWGVRCGLGDPGTPVCSPFFCSVGGVGGSPHPSVLPGSEEHLLGVGDARYL